MEDDLYKTISALVYAYEVLFDQSPKKIYLGKAQIEQMHRQYPEHVKKTRNETTFMGMPLFEVKASHHINVC